MKELGFIKRWSRGGKVSCAGGQLGRKWKRVLTSRVMSSSTIRFCLGTRPVLDPDEMQRAPVSVMELGPTVGSGDFMCSGSMAYS